MGVRESAQGSSILPSRRGLGSPWTSSACVGWLSVIQGALETLCTPERAPCYSSQHLSISWEGCEPRGAAEEPNSPFQPAQSGHAELHPLQYRAFSSSGPTRRRLRKAPGSFFIPLCSRSKDIPIPESIDRPLNYNNLWGAEKQTWILVAVCCVLWFFFSVSFPTQTVFAQEGFA